MSERQRVDVEEINRLRAAIRKINALDLNLIDFYEGGEKLEISQQRKDEWAFTGMSNADFIDTDFYKTGWTQRPELIEGAFPVD
jgi:hypothetical protein